MAQQIEEKDRYLLAFEGFEKSLNGQADASIHALRREAIARFADLGFPTTRDEAWIHTSVAPLTRIPFQPATGNDSHRIAPERIAPFTFGQGGAPAALLVFVNGLYAPELSDPGDLPGGVQAGSLADALQARPDLVGRHLAKHAPYKAHAFTALNTAFLRDGAFVHVPKGVVAETPIHLLFLSSAPGDPTVSHPRSLVLADEHSQVTLTETYAGEGAYFTNAVTEVVAGDSAVVDHYKLELEAPDAFHIATMQTCQGRSSNVSTHAISLGGALVRNEVNALLAGEGCEATVNGFYLLEGRQHVDNHTLIEHAEPSCASHELYKGILGGASRGVFRGKIHVHRKAQKTDAYQANRSLLLSNDANINTKPQLEIYADDVKCSHGATIGQLDENAIFYLRSRGLNRETAHRIMVHAFAGDILDRIKVEPVRQRLDRVVMEKFERARE